MRGSLADKMCGVIQCSLGMEITEESPSSLMVKTVVYMKVCCRQPNCAAT